MMDGKKYQVFVSSTFNDLRDERRSVMTALMEAGYIPAGMEFFGAVDEEQFQHIKRVIDDSDYYIVIVGNRYGTLDRHGLSYTEQEYEYAISRNIKVIALVHSDPQTLPQVHGEKTARLQKKLDTFRKKLLTARVVSFWTNASVLPKDAIVAMSKQTNLFPAIGWTRANQVTSIEALTEINELRKKVAELEAKIAADSALPFPEDIAQVDEVFTVKGKTGPLSVTWTADVTWASICVITVGHLLVPQWDETIKTHLAKALYRTSLYSVDALVDSAKLDDGVFNAIRMQMSAYRLVTVTKQSTNIPAGYTGLVWTATPTGARVNFDSTIVRTKKVPPAAKTPG